MYFLFLIFALSSGYDGCPLDRLVSSCGLEWLRWFALMCFLLFALSAAGSDRMFEQLQILNQPPLTQIDCTNQINLILQGSPTTFFIQNHSMLRYLVFPTKFQLSKFHMEKCEKMKSLVKKRTTKSESYCCLVLDMVVTKVCRPYQKLRHMC